ncbi:hypothetical protein D3C76_1515330 [compost metagenome]
MKYVLIQIKHHIIQQIFGTGLTRLLVVYLDRFVQEYHFIAPHRMLFVLEFNRVYT